MAIEFAIEASKDPESPLFGMIDEDNVVVAGHSMGATCSIAASKAMAPVKLTVTQHPGVCGPFGPPPLPATWMPSDLREVMEKNPVLFTTATNDGAFWPAPHTAEHEWGCYEKTIDGLSEDAKKHAFLQFSEAACTEDNDRKPFPDGGHNCPMKKLDGGAPESPWVLTAIKLYTHMDGSEDSMCYKMMFGNETSSIVNSKDIEKFDLNGRGKSTQIDEKFIQ